MNEKRKYTIKIIYIFFSKLYQKFIKIISFFVKNLNKYIVSCIIVQMLYKLNIVAKFS